MAALEAADEVIVSAGTVVEALIVSIRQESVRLAVTNLIEGFGFDVVAVTQASAERISRAYERWGRGLHPASLNFGDCFAYQVASEHGCALLYAGDDFSKTDIVSVL